MIKYRIFQTELDEFVVQRWQWWFPFWVNCWVNGISYVFNCEEAAIAYLKMRLYPIIDEYGFRKSPYQSTDGDTPYRELY